MYDWKPLDRYLVSYSVGGETVYMPKVDSLFQLGAQIEFAQSMSDEVFVYREHRHKSIHGNKLFLPCDSKGISPACGSPVQLSEVY